MFSLDPNPGWRTQSSEKNLKQANTLVSFVGKHCILELRECNQQRLNDESFLRTTLSNAVKLSGATLLNLVTHKFQPFGVTGLALLAESHISIHTWPENKCAAIDVFTCGEHTMPTKACNYFVDQFESQDYSLKTLQRDIFHMSNI